MFSHKRLSAFLPLSWRKKKQKKKNSGDRRTCKRLEIIMDLPPRGFEYSHACAHVCKIVLRSVWSHTTSFISRHRVIDVTNADKEYHCVTLGKVCSCLTHEYTRKYFYFYFIFECGIFATREKESNLSEEESWESKENKRESDPSEGILLHYRVTAMNSQGCTHAYIHAHSGGCLL